jgi:hypothetical protein
MPSLMSALLPMPCLIPSASLSLLWALCLHACHAVSLCSSFSLAWRSLMPALLIMPAPLLMSSPIPGPHDTGSYHRDSQTCPSVPVTAHRLGLGMMCTSLSSSLSLCD